MLFNLHGFTNDVMRLLLGELVLQLLVQQTRKLGVEPLITGNQEIALTQTGHQATLLEPEDGAEGTAEEDALHNRKGEQTGRKTRVFVLNPLKRPIGLLLDGGNRLNRLEELVLLLGVLDVCINQETVCFTVDRLHQILTRIEELRFRRADFPCEAHGQVLHDNSVRAREEPQNLLDEVAFVVRELVLPITQILRQVNLLWNPEDRHVLLVHLPQRTVRNREDDVAIRIFLKKWFVLLVKNVLWNHGNRLRVQGTA